MCATGRNKSVVNKQAASRGLRRMPSRVTVVPPRMIAERGLCRKAGSRGDVPIGLEAANPARRGKGRPVRSVMDENERVKHGRTSSLPQMLAERPIDLQSMHA
jgi:hypothetical protein